MRSIKKGMCGIETKCELKGDGKMVEKKIDFITVIYKETLPSGEEIVSKNSYKAWEEHGSYTVFYDDYHLESPVFVIPTRLVLSIELFR